MIESPDYFFRVREIGRLRQTTQRAELVMHAPKRVINTHAHHAN